MRLFRAMTSRPVLPGWPPHSPAFCAKALPAEARIRPIGTGERTVLVRAGEAAEFSTMEPHAFGVRDETAEMLCILDHDGTRTHLGPGSSIPETSPEET
jgi:hypothetical protein